MQPKLDRVQQKMPTIPYLLLSFILLVVLVQSTQAYATSQRFNGKNKNSSLKRERVVVRELSPQAIDFSILAAATKTAAKQVAVPVGKSAAIVLLVKSLLASYSDKLIRFPFATKIISSALVGGVGDLLIQLLNQKKGLGAFNFRRWLVFTAVAGFYIAPAIHLWFNYLGYLVLPASLGKFGVAFVQMALDQTFGAVIINAGFFYAFALSDAIFPPNLSKLQNVLVEGTKSVRSNMWETLVANWYCWPVINFLNFLVIPLEFRVLFSNFAAVFWNMFLSTIANRNAAAN